LFAARFLKPPFHLAVPGHFHCFWHLGTFWAWGWMSEPDLITSV
jgi:hypothetical protein